MDTNTNIGWIVVLREDLRADLCYDMPGGWDDFIIGTDPMCGTTDHICVFNKTDDSSHYDLERDGLIEFDGEPRPLSKAASRFVEAFKENYGEDSIRLVYGAVMWYS